MPEPVKLKQMTPEERDRAENPELWPDKKPFTTIPFSVPEMELLDITTLNLVAELAGGQTKEEIFEMFSCDPDDFSPHELAWFNKFFNFGKGHAVRTAVDNLISISRKDHKAALTILFGHGSSKFEPSQLESAAASGELILNWGDSAKKPSSSKSKSKSSKEVSK